MTASDRIELRQIRVTARHGLLPEEAARPQPFAIDLAVEADLGPAGRADDLDLTVDYGVLVERVVAVATTQRFGLLEALAEAVAACVLATARVTAVTVTVTKLRPPVGVDLGTVGVTIRRVA